MRFKNTTGEKKPVMFVDGKSKLWKFIRPGETCDIAEHYGRNLGFEEVKAMESEAGRKKVETKVLDKPKKSTKRRR